MKGRWEEDEEDDCSLVWILFVFTLSYSADHPDNHSTDREGIRVKRIYLLDDLLLNILYQDLIEDDDDDTFSSSFTNVEKWEARYGNYELRTTIIRFISVVNGCGFWKFAYNMSFFLLVGSCVRYMFVGTTMRCLGWSPVLPYPFRDEKHLVLFLSPQQQQTAHNIWNDTLGDHYYFPYFPRYCY